MKKIIWLLLGAVLVWAGYDFFRDSAHQKEVEKEQYTQMEQIQSASSAKTEEESVKEDPVSNDSTEVTGEDENLEVVDSPEFDQNEKMEFPASSKMTIGNNPGQTAYDFELEDLNGDTIQLSDFKGQKVFLNFWASWCPPCKVEMPHLQEFSEMQDEVIVLGVNVTSSEKNPENIPLFLEENGITFQNVYGTPLQFDQYQAQSLPTSYFIGSDGVIYDRVVGPVTVDALTTRFELID